MTVDYNGLTRNSWAGTWSPTSGHPVVIDNEIRGTLHSLSGGAGDQLANIPGQRLQEGMMVFIKNGYTSNSGATYLGNTYYTYRCQQGETRNTLTGALPNSDSNWTPLQINAGYQGGSRVVAGTNIDVESSTLGDVQYYVVNAHVPVQTQSYAFNESMEWVVNHNHNTDKFIETLVDSKGNRFFAKVSVVDANTFKVNMTTAVAGRVDVIFV